eukprot:5574394-Amphidinium_carterae.1
MLCLHVSPLFWAYVSKVDGTKAAREERDSVPPECRLCTLHPDTFEHMFKCEVASPWCAMLLEEGESPHAMLLRSPFRAVQSLLVCGRLGPHQSAGATPHAQQLPQTETVWQELGTDFSESLRRARLLHTAATVQGGATESLVQDLPHGSQATHGVEGSSRGVCSSSHCSRGGASCGSCCQGLGVHCHRRGLQTSSSRSSA